MTRTGLGPGPEIDNIVISLIILIQNICTFFEFCFPGINNFAKFSLLLIQVLFVRGLFCSERRECESPGDAAHLGFLVPQLLSLDERNLLRGQVTW